MCQQRRIRRADAMLFPFCEEYKRAGTTSLAKQNPPNSCHPSSPPQKKSRTLVQCLDFIVRVMTFERIGLSECCRGSWQRRYWIQNYVQSQCHDDCNTMS